VPTSQSFEFLTRLYFYPGQAHNGYLDVTNDLGLLGAMLLVGYLATYVAQALKLLAIDRAQGALYLGLVFQQLVSNLSESRWFNVLSVDFVMMTLATTALARDLLEGRLRTLMALSGR
jgi:O-antigen ligase